MQRHSQIAPRLPTKIRIGLADAYFATLNDTGEDEIKRTEEAVAS